MANARALAYDRLRRHGSNSLLPEQGPVSSRQNILTATGFQIRDGCGGGELMLDSNRHVSVEGIALHWIMRMGTMLVGIIAFSVGGASPVLAQRFSFERSFDVS